MDREADLLVLAIEAEVRGEEPFLRRVVRGSAATEVDQQPSEVQRGNRLSQSLPGSEVGV